MSEFKITSRSALYQSEDESMSSENELSYAPNLEFEEIEVAVSESEKTMENEEVTKENDTDEEFAFPLFAGAASQNDVMKISLKEAEEEVILNERPETYYRAFQSETSSKQYEMAAVTFEQIWLEATAPPIDTHPWKVINLYEHNKKIEAELRHGRKSREGKRKRVNKIACRERRLERERQLKRIEREEKKQKYKPQGHSWKSKNTKNKVKKPSAAGAVGAKPKYRTE